MAVTLDRRGHQANLTSGIITHQPGAAHTAFGDAAQAIGGARALIASTNIALRLSASCDMKIKAGVGNIALKSRREDISASSGRCYWRLLFGESGGIRETARAKFWASFAVQQLKRRIMRWASAAPAGEIAVAVAAATGNALRRKRRGWGAMRRLRSAGRSGRALKQLAGAVGARSSIGDCAAIGTPSAPLGLKVAAGRQKRGRPYRRVSKPAPGWQTAGAEELVISAEGEHRNRLNACGVGR